MVTSTKLSQVDNKQLNKYIDLHAKALSLQSAELLFEFLRSIYQKDNLLTARLCKRIILKFAAKAIQSTSLTAKEKQVAVRLYEKALVFCARDDFDCFMLYTEKDREYKDKFWIHRRNSLMSVVEGYQRIADRRHNPNSKPIILFVESPPRVGKTTLLDWFLVWLSAKNPELSNLFVGHSSALAKSIFEESEVFINDSKYKFYDIFPELRNTCETQAKELNINLGKSKRYKSMQFRSIDSNLSGVVEASLVLAVDDVITGIEEALSPDRVAMKTQKVATDVLQRKANSNVDLIFNGTPWCRNDPFEVMWELYKDDENYEVIKISNPATDDNGKSYFNFNEELKIGFTDEFYRKKKEEMDEISYNALYMLNRLDREGLLFNMDKFPRFTPDKLKEKPLAKHNFGDVAWGGGDFLAFPIVYEYSDGYYLADAVFNKNDKTVTQPLVAAKIMQHELYQCQFEANNGGDEYAETISDILKKEKYSCLIRSKKSENNSNAKNQRIIKNSPEIQKLHILNKENQSDEYKAFLSNLVTYNQNGKVKHDDAPDSLALLYDELLKPTRQVVTRFRRTF